MAHSDYATGVLLVGGTGVLAVGIFAVITGIFGRTVLGLVTIMIGAVLISVGYGRSQRAKERNPPARHESVTARPSPPAPPPPA